MIRFNPQLRPNISLYDEVHSLGKTDVGHVRKLYGTVGADIFEGKTPSIVHRNKKSKNIITRIKNWFQDRRKVDYEKGDSLWGLMFKYFYNNKKGSVDEIKTTFGERGAENLKRFKTIGYIK